MPMAAWERLNLLEGVRILDFSALFPGPFATRILSDLGAEVLRVESPRHPDMLKAMPPLVDGQSAAHRYINRDKGSIVLDLASNEGRERVYELLADYDIVLEQFRPGVLTKHGLGYDDLKAHRPDLIYCSLTGYGQTGPYRDRAGHDINYLALSGLASYSGRSDTGPVLSGTQVADVAGSLYTAIAISSAVVHREKTGEGGHLDIGLADCAFALNAMFGAGGLATATSPQLGREILNGGHVYDYYECADGRYLAVGWLEPKFATAFFEAIGKMEWLPRAATLDPDAMVGLKADIAALIAGRTRDDWVEVFEAVDACVEPVLDLQEAKAHPQFQARGLIVAYECEDGVTLEQVGSPIRLG